MLKSFFVIKTTKRTYLSICIDTKINNQLEVGLRSLSGYDLSPRYQWAQVRSPDNKA